MISHVAPVQIVQVIAGGKVVAEQKRLRRDERQGRWIEVDRTIELDVRRGSRRRAFGVGTFRCARCRGAHESGVRRHRRQGPLRPRLARSPGRGSSIGRWRSHRKRSFAEKARVLDDFQKSRDILLRIRQGGGLPAGGVPDEWIDDRSSAAIDPSRRTHRDEDLSQFLQAAAGDTAA